MHAKIQYWIDSAQYDLETAEIMLQTKRYLYVGFMCHQVVEKSLKAVIRDKGVVHMDKNAAIKYSKAYAEAVKKRFSPDKVVMYGSYANGNPTEDSDIDIAVIFNGFAGDWFKVSSQLWKLTCGVNTIIEPVLLDAQNDQSGFVKEILRTGIEV